MMLTEGTGRAQRVGQGHCGGGLCRLVSLSQSDSLPYASASDQSVDAAAVACL